MKIIEPDCYLEHINGVYHLYLLKNKKELKEDSEDKFKIGGYYIEIDSALKAIIKFRQHKKYSFKEDWKQSKLLLNKYLFYKQEFNKYLCQIYNPIKKLKSELFIYEKNKLNYWK